VVSASRETELVRALRQVEAEKAAKVAAAAERQWLADNFGLDPAEAKSVQSKLAPTPSTPQRLRGKAAAKVGRAIEDETVRSIADLIYLAIKIGGVTAIAFILLNIFVVGTWVQRARDSGSIGAYLIQNTLGLNVPFITGAGGTDLTTAANATATGRKVAETARAWAGKQYKPGVPAMCASFVRSVLAEAGVTVGVSKGSAGPLMADSFAGKDLGQIVKNKGDLQPGDIVMFQRTYNGPGRWGITHVGIYVGDGEIVDRPTAGGSVKLRSIDTFPEFWGGLRPSAYGADDGGSINTAALMEAIKSQESGGNTVAVNGRTGAMGAWQILPSNLPSWSKQCLGRQITASQFMGDPNLQRQIVECKLTEYAQTHAAKANGEEELVRRVASTWYSGNGDLWDNARRQGPGGSEPSIREYTVSIWQKYQGHK
jgi:cell wall-associated NlpC family hydrolase